MTYDILQHNRHLREALQLYLDTDECVCTADGHLELYPCMFCQGKAALENTPLDNDTELYLD